MAGRETTENTTVSTSTSGDGTETVERPGAADADPALATPDGARLFVPPLLSGLDAEETAESSGCALCLLVGQYPDIATDVVDRLVERLVADPNADPVVRTLATLVETHDETVCRGLLDASDRKVARKLYGHVQQTAGWDLDAQTASADDLPRGISHVVELEESDDDASPGTDYVERDTGPEPDESVGDAEAGATRHEGQSRTERRRQKRIQQVATSETFQRIRSRSRFEELQVIAPPTDRRYGTIVRTRAATADDEYGVAIRLCPEADADEFTAALGRAVDDWETVHSRGVVSAVDWGRRPRPWVATEYVEETLGQQGRLDPTAVLAHAHTLTAGLAELHQQDVVHGAVDPENVVYATDVLDEQKPPMLDNVGLMTVFRQSFDPSSYLDPRYAAPEYFDSQYGGLDHATDIYQLGMVLYRAATGSHPFDGDFETVARKARNDHPPAPSTVESAFPEAFDEIIAKATAKQKLTRYETANQFHRDVDRLCKRVLD